MSFSGQHEPARGGEVQFPGVARDLSDHEGKVATADAFFQREKQVGGAVGADMDQPVAQVARQTGQIRPATCLSGCLVLHPQERAFVAAFGRNVARRADPRRAFGQRDRKRRTRGFARRGEDVARPAEGRSRAPVIRPCFYGHASPIPQPAGGSEAGGRKQPLRQALRHGGRSVPAA